MKLPLVSYHGGHSHQYCDHAAPETTLRGNVEAYVNSESAYFGITEHQARPGRFLYPEEKEAGRTEEHLFNKMTLYFAEARGLQKEFSDHAQMLVGFETEMCDENAFELIDQLRREHQPDYIVGSVHHVQGQPIDFDQAMYDEAVKQQGSHEKLFARYYEQQYELMQACRPEVIGHFDLIKIFANGAPVSAEVKKLMERNIEFGISYGAIFEINARAFRKKLTEPYPGNDSLDMIQQRGGLVTLGDDSHGADQIFAYYDQTEPFIQERFDSIVLLKKEGNQLQQHHLKLDGSSLLPSLSNSCFEKTSPNPILNPNKYK